jgi:hypothetical protein
VQKGFALIVSEKSEGGNTTKVYEQMECNHRGGVVCDAGQLRYSGGVWHHPSIAFPSAHTK